MTLIHQKENKKYSGDNRCLDALHGSPFQPNMKNNHVLVNHNYDK